MIFYKKAILQFLNSRGFVTSAEVSELKSQLQEWKGIWPPGHYYSSVHERKDVVLGTKIDYSQGIPGIDLKDQQQLVLLNELATTYDEKLFPHEQIEGPGYYFNNDYFGYSDGLFLQGLMRKFRPRRILEIGSGFSSALMLDINKRFLHNEVNLRFVEPFPEERLLKLITEKEHNTVIKKFVQDVPAKEWQELEENDILFIDSSHVSKYQSDVNFLFFNVIPQLKKGVIIHIHDVFFPFEYPAEWLRQGRAWTEAYLLRAFLQYNDSFEIILFNSYLEGKYPEWFEKNMPLCLKRHKTIEIDGKTRPMNTGGQSIYIRKMK